MQVYGHRVRVKSMKVTFMIYLCHTHIDVF